MRFYIAPVGNDDSSGTQPDSPFRTLERAQAAVRDLIRQGIDADVEVLLRGGDYFLRSPLTFGPQDSIPGGHRVIYRNYPGEKPVIYAARPLTGWQDNGDGSYTLTDADLCHILYSGKRAIHKARFPAAAYATAEAVEPVSDRQFRVEQAVIDRISQVEGLQVYIWPGGPRGDWNWFTDIIPAAAVDRETRTITLQSPARYVLGTGSRFFLMGARGFLEQRGQFFYDPLTRMLTVIPHDAPPDAEPIIAPYTPRAVAFVGSSPADVVRNIVLEGLEICCTDSVNEIGGDPGPSGDAVDAREDGMIYLEYAEGITVRGCHLHHAGMHGIFGNRWVQGCVFDSNYIHDAGFTGILLSGTWRGIHYENHHNQITNNYIHDMGQVIGQGSGIQLVQSGDNLVAHNRIHTTSRYSISLKGPHPQHIVYHQVDGVYVREHNKVHLSHTRYNRIQYNDMSNANVNSQDTGVIESWGVYGPDNRIQHNVIHDSLIPFSFGFVIYLDDMASYYTITHNILHRLQKQTMPGVLWSIMYVKGIGNRLLNNIIADCGAAEEVFGAMGFVNDPNHDLAFGRNIVYRAGRRLYGMHNWNSNKFALADENTFYDGEDGEFVVGGVPDAQSFEDWRRVNGCHYDQFSQIADPLFMNAEAGDYRLRYDSPVYRFPFEDIDPLPIGLRADFPFADPHEAISRVFIYTDSSHAGRGFLDLRSGAVRRLTLSARTVSGYIADISADSISWVSANPQVASVDDHGVVTAHGAGVARISATLTRNDVQHTTALDVLVDDEFTAVEISAPRTVIMNGESLPLKVYGRTRFGRWLNSTELKTTFISSRPNVAFVTPEGVVITQFKGTTEITAVAVCGAVRYRAAVTIEVDSVR
jgi:hypothetical protein